MTSDNAAAWLDAKGAPLRVGPAPMPAAPGPGELVVRNRCVAVNPLDWHMADWGVFVQEFPAVIGCDVAGEVHLVGPDVTRFKPGDRVIAHAINLVSGKAQDGAFARYSVVPAAKAAHLPPSIPFESGAVLPLALEAAACALYKTVPGEALPGVPTPAMGLPLPPPTSSSPSSAESSEEGKKCIFVNGGSSSTGLLTTQLAVASGLRVVAAASPRNFALCREAGASAVVDYRSPSAVDDIVQAVLSSSPSGSSGSALHGGGDGGGGGFVGIYDAISTEETYDLDTQVLARLGGGHLACTHPPPTSSSSAASSSAASSSAAVKSGMIFAVDDVARPVWEDFVTPALASGALKCLPPPRVVGHGLEFVQRALELCRAGVSGEKLVVTL